MFNSNLKKESIKKLEQELIEYEKESLKLQKNAVKLHQERSYAVSIIEGVEEFINQLANTPKEFDKTINQIEINIENFRVLSKIKYDEIELAKLAGGGVATGLATGVATAALAPTAAMAVATTFGTASTGAAISGLSGAAATKAALAWIGGGSLAAGGGGVVAGKTILALAGPIGWGIGAASLGIGSIYANKKNKEAAIKADKERVEILKGIKIQKSITEEVLNLKFTTRKLTLELEQSLITLVGKTNKIKSYTDFSQEGKNQLRALINNTKSLSQLFIKELGGNDQKNI